MIYSFFEMQLKRLVVAFGDKAVNTEKAMLLWKKFKDVEDRVFVEVVDNLVLNQRQTPILDDFNREVMRARAVIRTTTAGKSDDMVCVTCDGSGWFLRTPPGLVVPVAERCECKSFRKKIEHDWEYQSAFSDQDRAVMVATCIDRMNGGVSDGAWKEFQKALSQQIRNHEVIGGAKLQ